MDPQSLQNLLLAIIAVEGALIAYTLHFASAHPLLDNTKANKKEGDELPLPKARGLVKGDNGTGIGRPKAFRVIVEKEDTGAAPAQNG